MRKKKRTQSTIVRNEGGNSTTNFTDIKRIIREHNEQLYADLTT